MHMNQRKGRQNKMAKIFIQQARMEIEKGTKLYILVNAKIKIFFISFNV